MQADSAHGIVRSTAETISYISGQGGGPLAFWRGTQPTVIRLGFGAALHFSLLESIKPLFESRKPDGTVHMTTLGAALTGGLARGLAAMLSCPITVVKTRMEYVPSAATASSIRIPQYANTLDALVSIARTEGIRGLYRGLGPTILSNAPFSALYYAFYTRLQARLRESGTISNNTVVNFASGTIAAVAATLITQPADVVRTRVQLGVGGGGGGGGQRGVGGGLNVLQHVARSQGVKGLLVGAAPRVVKRTLQTALVWTIYEELMPALTKAALWIEKKPLDEEME